MNDLTLSDMLALRKELDPDAPDMIMFPESTQSLPNEGIERFNSYVPDMHGQRMGMCHAADGEFVRYSDHERIVKELQAARFKTVTAAPLIGQYALCPLCGSANTGRWTHERGTPFLGCYDCGCCAPETEWQKGRVE